MQTPARLLAWLGAGLVLIAAGLALAIFAPWQRPPAPAQPPAPASPARPSEFPAGQIRSMLFASLQPVTLANCDMQRFGEGRDGGYLKRFFHVANLHMNNHACEPGHEPFPAWAYEVLFVSRRLGQVDAGAPPRAPFHPLHTANTTLVPDGQINGSGN